MKRTIRKLAVSFVVLSAVAAWSQTDMSGSGSDTEPATAGPKLAYTYPDSASPMSFLSDAAENSTLTLGVGGGMIYNSKVNQFSNSGNNESAILYQLRPSIRIQQYRRKLSWTFGYLGGLQSRSYFGNNPNFNNTQKNIFSHNANADILWQFSPRWQMHVNDMYIYSADPFDAYLTTAGIPTQNNPNPAVYQPLSVYSQNAGLLALTNQLSAHDTVTFTGTENFRRSSNYYALTSPYQNLISYGGRADYQHQLSARLSLGSGYEFDSLDFGHGLQRSGIQTIKFSADYLIKPNMSISVWVGPEYTALKNIVHFFIFTETVHSSQWNVSGGANFGWRGVHNSFRAAFNHQVSYGSVLLGTTNVYNGSLDYRRILSPRWTLGGTVQYFNNASISISRRTFEETLASAILTRRLSPSLSADLHYGLLHETQRNIYPGNPTYWDSQVGVNIQYNWKHPLGR